jgi:hypothetical protein
LRQFLSFVDWPQSRVVDQAYGSLSLYMQTANAAFASSSA